MMKRLTAEQAIHNINNEMTTFMGISVAANIYPYEKRDALQKMAENNEISPKEYWKALKMTPKETRKSLLAHEYGEDA